MKFALIFLAVVALMFGADWISRKWRQMRRKLDLAETVLASAYQAVGHLVLNEPADPKPSEKDQTDLLDMLSDWETWTIEQADGFLPWPKEFAQREDVQ